MLSRIVLTPMAAALNLTGLCRHPAGTLFPYTDFTAELSERQAVYVMDAGDTPSGGDVDPQALRRHAQPSSKAWLDLRQSLDALAQLSTGQIKLTEALSSVAQLAVQAVPGAEGAGLTLLESDRVDTKVSTADFVTAVDDIQYSLGQGPCLSAAAEGVTVQSPALGADSRWPDFGVRAAALGVHSALSIPLTTSTGVVGALNIYAHPTHAFSEQSAEMGHLFAVPAAIAVQNAHVLAQAVRLAEQLQHALAGRSIIDQAIGILMSRSGYTAEQALNQLRTLSITHHHKLHHVAERLVDEAVRRARARHHGTP